MNGASIFGRLSCSTPGNAALICWMTLWSSAHTPRQRTWVWPATLMLTSAMTTASVQPAPPGLPVARVLAACLIIPMDSVPPEGGSILIPSASATTLVVTGSSVNAGGLV